MSNSALTPYLLFVDRRIIYLLNVQSGCIFKHHGCQELSKLPDELRRVYPAKQHYFPVYNPERVPCLIYPCITLIKRIRNFPPAEPDLLITYESEPVEIPCHPHLILYLHTQFLLYTVPIPLKVYLMFHAKNGATSFLSHICIPVKQDLFLLVETGCFCYESVSLST